MTPIRSITLQETIEEYHSNEDNLKKSEICRRRSFKSFRDWIEKIWLPLDKTYLK